MDWVPVARVTDLPGRLIVTSSDGPGRALVDQFLGSVQLEPSPLPVKVTAERRVRCSSASAMPRMADAVTRVIRPVRVGRRRARAAREREWNITPQLPRPRGRVDCPKEVGGRRRAGSIAAADRKAMPFRSRTPGTADQPGGGQ